ncbi:XIAP-associated factor 1 [Artemisia annua]|uniref:XIAP-associated factor 1 n=1 Tax=Artemisia annua TaxID=35608 RepID=A0A2U1KI59_ARTAN|nr:XIAP-associated factor 1 [Artemisia annua]
MVPKKLAEEHYLTTHAPVSCSLCSETMAPETLATHVGEQCSQRIVTCDYCEFPLPAIDLFEHQEICGNRTERCDICSRYIRLRERAAHEVTCNGSQVDTADSSRASEAERERNARRRPPPQDFTTRRLIFTIAITGVAVLLARLGGSNGLIHQDEEGTCTSDLVPDFLIKILLTHIILKQSCFLTGALGYVLVPPTLALPYRAIMALWFEPSPWLAP